MDVDVRGRVANVKLGKSRCLLPLFEAIINSIHAIEESKLPNGSIEIRIERDQSEKPLFEEAPNYPVSGFTVEDNGIGFNDQHFRSFCKSDTTEKITRGGKGVGRFLWLKAFRQAEISSVFVQNGGLKKREFTFELSETGVTPADPVAQPCPESRSRTTVRLTGFKSGYQEHCPKTADAIANRIVEHFLEMFTLKRCPKTMVLIDEVEGTRIDLNRRYSSEMRVESKSLQMQVKGHKFRLTHVRLAALHAQQHKLIFCAHGRSVRTESLAKHLPYLDHDIPDNSGSPFVYAAYLSGDFLDDSVVSERTQFDISEEQPELDFPDEVSWPELVAAILPKSKAFLKPYLVPLNAAKEERIREYVKTKAPQYRHLLTQCKKDLALLSAHLSDEKLDLELYKIDQKHDAELKVRYERLLAAGDKKSLSHEERKKRFERFLEDWNEAGMAKLARHVAHRRATLSFLEHRLEVQEDDKYSREEAIHEVIFPLKKSSDDVRPDQMNLWVLDEKLAFHFYLASDKPISQMGEAVAANSLERPDLVIFGHPFAFVDSSPVFGSVVLVEFKRPARDDYRDDKEKNPIQQVYNYVKILKSGKATDRKGRPITVPESTPFYAYIVCDLMPSLEDQAVYAQLKKTPDGLGYFGYNDQVGVYVEIISFSKLIDDAKKRNAAFFSKLGLGVAP